MSGAMSVLAALPGPMKAAGGVAVLAAVMSLPMVATSGNPFWKIVLGGAVLVIVVIGVIQLIGKMREKSKARPFAGLIAKAGAGRAAMDPAAKARMDDLRKKFEEGVETFRSAGKDLYSLPWYLLVGPPGTGKTEMVRRSGIPFPPGLQDALQGTGGTMSMNWWFTNQAVILDTAGRLFMDDAEEGGSAAWKELLKMLREARPNCPVSGLLLVVSSENLLSDSSDQIEKTAERVARQLDTIQRSLDVRFPVSVLVTKCDRIVGFREFFETLSDPTAQHQVLGWTNPAELDEKFNPEFVEKHLTEVRQKLLKRRMGLLQNPVHSVDASLRRTDQVDELFELPDNLMRIGPALKRYLELIFTAGEWSPKPLFLRGIYFTSSMREGEALDVSISRALGVPVESLPGGGKSWEKDKAYFIKDVFLAKVFKEKGLVTRATNVGKTLRKQRLVAGVGTIAAMVVLAGLAGLGWVNFRASLGPPSAFWNQVRTVAAPEGGGSPADLSIVRMDEKGAVAYVGNQELATRGDLDPRTRTVVQLLEATTARAQQRIDPPTIAKPVAGALGFGDGFEREQTLAHRALVEQAVVIPLLQGARSKLQDEKEWGPAAVGALAQLIRVRTFAQGGVPADPSAANTSGATGMVAIDADVLARYVFPDAIYNGPELFKGDRDKVLAAVRAAYPNGWSAEDRPSDAVAGLASSTLIADAMERLTSHLLALGASPGSDMDKLQRLRDGLTKFIDEERRLLALPAVRQANAETPATMAQWATFEGDALPRLSAMASLRVEIGQVAASLGPAASDPLTLLTTAGEKLLAETAGYFQLLERQLPAPAGEGAVATEAGPIAELRTMISERATRVQSAVAQQLASLKGQVAEIAPLAAMGRSGDREAAAYEQRATVYAEAAQLLSAAGQPVAAAGERPTSLVRQLAEFDGARGQAMTAANAWAGWEAGAAAPLVPEARTRLQQERDRSLAATSRLLELAQMRRGTELVRSAVAGWPTDRQGVIARVAAVATAELAQANPDYTRLTRPQLPLTDMAEGGEFERGFHPAAAAEVLGDWREISAMLAEPAASAAAGGAAAGTGRAIIGRDELRADPAVRRAGEFAAAYVQSYMEYWRAQVFEAGVPRPANWQQFSERVRGLDHWAIHPKVADFKGVVAEAVRAVPPVLAGSESFRATQRQLEQAFAMVGDKTFEDTLAKGVFDDWKRLAMLPGGATAARDELVTAMQTSPERLKRFFRAYAGTGMPGTAYWNGFQLGALEALVRDTAGDLKRARDALVVAKGVPLAFGDSSLPDLSPEQVAQARAALATLAGKGTGAGGGGGAAAPADMDPALADLLAQLSGSDFMSRDRAWFESVRTVVSAVAQDAKPLRMSIVATGGGGLPRGGAGANAKDEFTYAAVRVGGRALGETFNIGKADTIIEERAKDLVVTLPLPAGQEMEIWVARDDFINQAVAGPPSPGSVIRLPGRWALLRSMLTGEATRSPEGVWTILTRAENGAYLWVQVRFDPALPEPGAWPTGVAWPAR